MSEEEKVDPREKLWLTDLEMGNFIFGAFAAGMVSFATFMWFFWYWGGFRIDSYYWWTWFTATLVVYGSWGPVAFAWLFTNFGNYIYNKGT